MKFVKNRLNPRRSPKAFTLIELLVVIAIIALLIGLLLPAVGKIRLAGWKTKSFSNIRSIATAAFSYQNDNKGFLPVVAPKPTSLWSVPSVRPIGPRGFAPEYYFNGTTQVATQLTWLCTWTFGGANCRGTWANYAGGQLDMEAADRPLNKYVEDGSIPAPPDGMPYSSNATERQARLFPVFEDPSDKRSHQTNWPAPALPDPTTGIIPSCYQDVGTSYQFNIKWHEQLEPRVGFTRAFFGGTRRLRAADAFTPSRFAWIHDEYADIVIYDPSPSYGIKNGYGEVNKSVMGFMDGHAAYLTVIPGRTTESYRNSQYTFVFEDLPVP